jgi:hypothetical protein
MSELPLMPVPENFFFSKSILYVRRHFKEARSIGGSDTLENHSVGRFRDFPIIMRTGAQEPFYDDVQPSHNGPHPRTICHAEVFAMRDRLLKSPACTRFR